MDQKAIILLSGGLDSATCLALAKQAGYACYALSFDYGQKQVAELEAANKIATSMGAIQHRIVKLGIGDLGGSALTDPEITVPAPSANDSIPVTYVPARNTIFLSVALGWAEILGASRIYTGMCCVDYSGYPDCRPEYLQSFQTMANLATKTTVEGESIGFIAPLMYLTKAETIQLGTHLGVDYSLTVSCYQADPQGRACGNCDACALRQRGFLQTGVEDPTRYF